MRMLVITSPRTKIPTMLGSTDVETKLSWELARLEENSLQLIPPEFAILAGVTGCDEDRRWYGMLFQQRLRIKQIVCVSVIKSDNHRAPRKASIAKSGRQLPKRDGASVFTQDLKVLFEMLRRHRELPRVRSLLSYPVVQQNQRPP